MNNLELSRLNTKMYNRQGPTPMFFEIWDYLDKNTFLHQKEVSIIFTPETQAMIKAASATFTVLKWKEHARLLRDHDNKSELSRLIFGSIKDLKDKQSVTIALTEFEHQTIEQL